MATEFHQVFPGAPGPHAPLPTRDAMVAAGAGTTRRPAKLKPPKAAPLPRKAPATVTAALLGTRPTDAKRQETLKKVAGVAPRAYATGEVPPALRDVPAQHPVDLIHEAFGDLDAPPPHPVAEHLGAAHSRLGAQLRHLRDTIARAAGAKRHPPSVLAHIDNILTGADLDGGTKALHQWLTKMARTDAGAHPIQHHMAAMLDNYNWDTMAGNLRNDARLHAHLDHGGDGDALRSLYADAGQYARAVKRWQDTQGDKAFVGGGSAPRHSPLLDDAMGLGDGARDETPESYYRMVDETWGDRAHHARLSRKPGGAFGLIAPDGTWHDAGGPQRHAEAAKAAGHESLEAALHAGWMHVASYLGEIHGHNPAGEYTPLQILTLKKLAGAHDIPYASVHKIVGGQHREFPIRLSAIHTIGAAVGRAVVGALGYHLGGAGADMLGLGHEGAPLVGAGMGLATGHRLIGGYVADLIQHLRDAVADRRRRKAGAKDASGKAAEAAVQKALADARGADAGHVPAPAATLSALRTALRIHNLPEALASNPAVQATWHLNVQPHVASAVKGGQAGTLAAVVRQGVALLKERGLLEDTRVAPGPEESKQHLRTALKLHGHLDHAASDPSAQEVWRKEVMPHIAQAVHDGRHADVHAITKAGIHRLLQSGHLMDVRWSDVVGSGPGGAPGVAAKVAKKGAKVTPRPSDTQHDVEPKPADMSRIFRHFGPKGK